MLREARLLLFQVLGVSPNGSVLPAPCEQTPEFHSVPWGLRWAPKEDPF